MSDKNLLRKLKNKKNISPRVLVQNIELCFNNLNDLNTQDSEGWTILHYAAKYGRSNIVQALLNKGMNIDLQTNNGRTILMLACIENNLRLVQLLLKKNANVNITTKDGSSALHFASTFGSIELLKLLIAYKANINSQSHTGSTALHLAVYANKPKILCHLLFETNIIPEIKDAQNRRAQDLSYISEEIREIFSEYIKMRRMLINTDQEVPAVDLSHDDDMLEINDITFEGKRGTPSAAITAESMQGILSSGFPYISDIEEEYNTYNTERKPLLSK